MDAKKTVKNFIKPNWVLTIIMLIPPFTVIGLLLLLCGTIPVSNRAKKSLAMLEENGWLDLAAQELLSENAKRYMKGNLILTDNFIFCKGTGRVYTYYDVRWVYRHRYTKRVLFIPIQVTDSLCLASRTHKPTNVVSMGKDKMDEIKNAMLEIYRHNNACLVGYSKENAAQYKQLAKR